MRDNGAHIARPHWAGLPREKGEWSMKSFHKSCVLAAMVLAALASVLTPGAAVKLSGGARCKHACQRCQNHRGQHARFMKTLHAPFSFFTGEPRPVWPGDVRPIISHPGQIPSSTRGGNRSPVSDRVRHAGFGESTQSQQAT